MFHAPPPIPNPLLTRWAKEQYSPDMFHAPPPIPNPLLTWWAKEQYSPDIFHAPPPIPNPLLTWWAKEQYSPDMFHAELFNYIWRKDTRGKGSPEDIRELLVQTPNTHQGEVPVRTDEGLMCRVSHVAPDQLDYRSLGGRGLERKVEKHEREEKYI